MGKININEKILIESLQNIKDGAGGNCWKNSCQKAGLGVDSLLKRIDARGNADWAAGSGSPRSARTSANIAKAEVLVCSQEGEPQAWPPTSRTSIQCIMLCWGLRRSEFFLDENLNPSTNWSETWRWNGEDYCITSSTNLSLNGDNVYSYTEQRSSYWTFV